MASLKLKIDTIEREVAQQVPINNAFLEVSWMDLRASVEKLKSVANIFCARKDALSDTRSRLKEVAKEIDGHNPDWITQPVLQEAEIQPLEISKPYPPHPQYQGYPQYQPQLSQNQLPQGHEAQKHPQHQLPQGQEGQPQPQFSLFGPQQQSPSIVFRTEEEVAQAQLAVSQNPALGTQEPFQTQMQSIPVNISSSSSPGPQSTAPPQPPQYPQGRQFLRSIVPRPPTRN